MMREKLYKILFTFAISFAVVGCLTGCEKDEPKGDKEEPSGNGNGNSGSSTSGSNYPKYNIPEFVLKGKVIDSSEQPIKGAKLDFSYVVDDKTTTKTVKTNSEGEYEYKGKIKRWNPEVKVDVVLTPPSDRYKGTSFTIRMKYQEYYDPDFGWQDENASFSYGTYAHIIYLSEQNSKAISRVMKVSE